MDTHTLRRDDADIVHDVHGPAPAPGELPLVAIGQPMDASGFVALAEHMPDKRIVAYDPRGLGRSTRRDGRTDNDPHTQADDVHALICEIGGPVDLLASSGGAVTALALVVAHPDDVRVLVAHEPPIIGVLPDARLASRVIEDYQRVYADRGFGAGMAAFLAAMSWTGEYTEEYFATGPPDPAAAGLPSDDDGNRDDPLLSGASRAVLDYEPDLVALTAAPTRIVVALGEETGDAVTARTARELAARLGQDPVVFPGHHGGFMDGRYGWAGKPAEFAARLREVLG